MCAHDVPRPDNYQFLKEDLHLMVVVAALTLIGVCVLIWAFVTNVVMY